MAYNGLFVAKTIQQSLDAPLPYVLPLTAFMTDFSAEASAAASITTRFASSGVVGTTYAAQTGNSTAVTVSLSTPAIASYTFPEVSAGQTLTPETLAQLYVIPGINAVAQAITQAAIGLFVSGNFSTNIVVPNATGFGLPTFASGVAVLDNLYAMTDNRYAIFNPSYKAGLLNSAPLIANYSIGTTEVIQKGLFPDIFGITPIGYNGGINTTDGNVVGAFFHKNSVVIAARTPVYEAVQGYGIVENFVEPVTKLPMQMRMWNDMNGNWRLTIASIYGVAVGANQAVRITTS